MPFLPETGNGRAGYAPRRGRGSWSRPFVKRQEPVKPDIIKNPLGDLLVRIEPADLKLSPAGLPSSALIHECHYAASYNWLAGKDSTILVPGQPPLWSPPKTASKLAEDSGNFYRDPNAARYPEYPLAPAVQAIMTCASDTLAKANLFACGSTLGNLLRFVRDGDKAFRFSIEVIGDTVFFIRKENDPLELIEGVRGFGHSFPDAYTTWPEDAKGSETHQRIVQYTLGSIDCLVRFECDGSFDNDSEAKVPRSDRASPLSTSTLTQVLSDASIFAPKSSSTGPLSVRQGGNSVAQASIFDLKTRSGRYGKSIKMEDIIPQLWLKQIPNFVVAYHDGYGLFQDIQIQDVRQQISNFEKDNADAIRQLVVLLDKIIAIATVDDKDLLEVYCSGQGVLEIRRQFGIGVHALPEALAKQWVAKCRHKSAGLEGEDMGNRVVAYSSSPDDSGNYVGASDDEKDFTACSAEGCGYCGRCTY